MPDIFTCWACGTSLLDRSKAKSSKFPFHCNKKCQDAYEKKCSDELKATEAWSDFMCGERECPKEFLDLAKERGLLETQRVAEPEEPTREERLAAIRAKRVAKAKKRQTSKKNAVKSFFSGVKGKRKCGTCGESGHNARTCKKK